MKSYRKLIYSAIVVVALGGLGAGAFFFWPHGLPEVAASANQPTGDALIARGQYLTVAADCAACHTTKGGKPFAGGLAFKLPFGTIYSPNISSDPVNGIGSWSDAEFVRAMRSGVGKHGEDLYPAFPYTSYALLSTDDILAIRAYMKTLAPVAEPSKENSLAFPFNQRYVMRGWKLLFVPGQPFTPDPHHDERWNQGAYLVEALEHCGECHTPRGLMFQRKQGVALSGGEVDGWKAWNITSDHASGLGSWKDAEIASFLSTGHAHGHGPAGGAMREAVDLSLSKLPPSDIDAIVSYLRTVPAVEGTPKAAKAPGGLSAETANSDSGTATKQELGEQVFAGACASCHGFDGTGKSIMRADILGAHSVSDVEGANLIRVILHGSSDSDGLPGKTMPAFASIYSDEEIAALANYVIAQIGGGKGTVKAEDVKKARE